MKVRMQVLKSGERYPFFLDDKGIPDFWVTHFATQRLRMSCTSSTMKAYLEDIKHLKRWEEINGRDLLEEIYDGNIPNRDDIKDIKEHCTFKVKALISLIASRNSKPKVIDMGKFYFSQTENLATVSKATYTERVSRIAEFLHFIGQERVKHKASSQMLFDELDKMKHRFLKSSNSPSLKSQPKFDKTGITDDAFEDFVALSRSDSKHNPFSMDVRFRNYIIVQALYETGLRYGELLALRIQDIGVDVEDPRLLVVRRHDSPEDPRKNEPTAKTLGRGISISKGLRDLLLLYIKEYRSQTSKAKTHPFIFVGHKRKEGSYETGMPVTHGTVNKLFEKLVGVNPEYFQGITPHTFRHYFNDRLSEMIDETRRQVKEEVARLEAEGKHLEAKHYSTEFMITEQRELEIRAELNGHKSLDSGRAYLKRTAKKQATQIRKQMEADLKNKVGGLHSGR